MPRNLRDCVSLTYQKICCTFVAIVLFLLLFFFLLWSCASTYMYRRCRISFQFVKFIKSSKTCPLTVEVRIGRWCGICSQTNFLTNNVLKNSVKCRLKIVKKKMKIQFKFVALVLCVHTQNYKRKHDVWLRHFHLDRRASISERVRRWASSYEVACMFWWVIKRRVDIYFDSY